MAVRKSSQKPSISPERAAEITASIEEWEAGKWAAQVAYGPACLCGLRKAGRCERHPPTPQE